ncbi:MAG: DHH family phosphoesterase [bacterium]|nr:DHH family phosphoesterase [bacterium]
MKAEYIAECTKIIRLIKEKNKFLIVSHIYPDGDAIGSVLGLLSLLIKLGKTASAYIADRIPRQFQHLPNIELIKTTLDKNLEVEVTFILDSSNIERIGLASRFISPLMVNIDHHPDNSLFADINLVDSSASSTSEIVFNLLKSFPLDRDIVSSLYYGLLSDTGGFMYGNTNQQTFKTALEMLRYGISPGEIAYKVFYSIPYDTMKLYIEIASSVKIDRETKIAWCIVPLEIMESDNFQNNTSPLLDILLRVEEADTVILFKEHKDKYRVSLRSKTRDVGSVARILGGGGHRGASAFDLLNKEESAILETVERIKTLLGGKL